MWWVVPSSLTKTYWRIIFYCTFQSLHNERINGNFQGAVCLDLKIVSFVVSE